MIIFWMRKSGTEPEKQTLKADGSFRRHDETMKKFRQSHPKISVVPARDIITADGHLLAPVDHVTLGKYARN